MKARRHGYTGSAYSTAPRGFKPRLIQSPPLNIVPCLDCGAEVGKPCLSSSGKQVRTHASRRRIALRTYREKEEVAP